MTWRMVLERYGTLDDFREHPYVTRARTWESVTSYLHPWFRKKGFRVEEQIRRELATRVEDYGRPELVRLPEIEVAGRSRRPVHFHRFRRRSRGRRQPDTTGSFWRITFPEPVAGPIALGFGCHFGLGLFRAVER